MPHTSLYPFPRYKTTDLNTFSHMFPRDASIWRRWLPSTSAHQYIGFDYDIKVGLAAQQALQNPTPDAMLQLGTLAKRIDAVAFVNPSLVDLIEIKATHLPAAYGQLIIYRDLWRTTFPTLPIRNLILVTQSIDYETFHIFTSSGITVYIVSPETT